MKCQICKKREGKLEFTNSTMDYIHGFTQMICRQCFVKMIEEEYKKIGKNLIKQKTLLKLELNENGGKNGRNAE